MCEDRDVPYIYVDSKEVCPEPICCVEPGPHHSQDDGGPMFPILRFGWQELGAAGQTKRPTSCMLILSKPLKGDAEQDSEFTEAFDEVMKKVKAQQYIP